jgi:hypothetical protein
MEEPGRVTPGDGTSAFVVCQSPPLDEALVVDPDDDPADGYTAIGGRTTGVMHVAAWRQWP